MARGQRELFSGQDVPSAVAVGGGRLYWVTNNSDSGEGNGAIHRANLDGSDPQTIATGQSLGESPGGGLAVDASYVYWTADNGTIWRANLDGTGAECLSPPGRAARQGWRLMAASSTGPTSTTARSGGPAWTGGNPKPIATGQVHPVGVAVDASHVYWANLDNGEIIQASLDGSNAKPVATGQNHPLGVAVDGDHLYWAVWFDGTIVQAGLDGSNPRLVASGQNTPTGLAVGWWVSVPRFLYLASPGGGIFVANLNASNPRPLVGAQSDTPAVAVDASYLYWATQNDVANGGGTITRAGLDGSDPQLIVIGSDNPTGVAVDASYLYWTTGGAGPSSGAVNRAGLARQRPAGHRHRAGGPADHGGGRRQPHLLGCPGRRACGSGADLGGRPATAATRRPSSPARTDQWGVAVDGSYLYWSNAGGNPNSGTIEPGRP